MLQETENLLEASSSDLSQSFETSLTNPEFVAESLPQNEPLKDTSANVPNDTTSSPQKANSDSIATSVGEPNKTAILFTDRTIELPILTEGDRYEEINAIAAAVMQLYKPVVSRKEAIKQAFTGFKITLGLHEESSVSECFKVLRDNVDLGTQLELVCAGQEPLKLKVNEISPPKQKISDEVKKAITFFNSCLNLCQKFCGEKELRMADVQFRLEDLHLMPLTKEGQTLYAKVNEVPTYIDELSDDIEILWQEIYKVKDILRPK